MPRLTQWENWKSIEIRLAELDNLAHVHPDRRWVQIPEKFIEIAQNEIADTIENSQRIPNGLFFDGVDAIVFQSR